MDIYAWKRGRCAPNALPFRIGPAEKKVEVYVPRVNERTNAEETVYGNNNVNKGRTDKRAVFRFFVIYVQYYYKLYRQNKQAECFKNFVVLLYPVRDLS